MAKPRPLPDKPVVELGNAPPKKPAPEPEQPQEVSEPAEQEPQSEPVASKEPEHTEQKEETVAETPVPEPKEPEQVPVVEPIKPPEPEAPLEQSTPQREFNWEERLIQLEKRGNRLLQYKIGNVVTVELGKFNDQGFYRISIPAIEATDQQFFNIILRQAQIETVNSKTPLPSIIKKVIAEHSLVVKNAPALTYHIMARLSPWGKLYPLLADEHVQEVLCRDNAVSVIIKDYLNLGWFESTVEFNRSEQAVVTRRFLANTKGHEVITDEGHYASFSISADVNDPSMIYVKKSNPKMLPITLLINRGIISQTMAAYLWMATSFGGLIAVVGPTKSAKTTIINSVASLMPFNKTLSIIEKAVEHQYPNRKYSKYNPVTKGANIDAPFLMAPDAIIVDPLERNIVNMEKFVSYVRTGRTAFVAVEAPDVEVATETLRSYGFPDTSMTTIVYTGLVDNMWKVLGIYEAPFKSPVLKWSNADEKFSTESTKDLVESSLMLQRLATKKGWDTGTLMSSFEARNKFLNGLVISQTFSPEEFSRSLMIGRQLIY